MFASSQINKIFIFLGVAVAVFGCGFYIGQKITRDYYILEIKSIENKALQIENENLIKKIDTQTELKNKVNEVMNYAEKDKQDIENAYSVSVSLLDAGLQSYGQSTYKMQLSPDADTTAGTTAKRADQCHIKDNRDFKGLSERLLKQAKEYDLLKLKYNTLLSIWKQTETKINNFN